MYVITHHHDYDEVLLGPIDWRPGFIASVIQQDLDLPFKPTILASQEQNIPFDIIDKVRVRPVKEVRELINSKIQRYEGPFWSYTDSEATATYTAVDKPLDLVKGDLKQITSSVRYAKEIAGVKVTIQDGEVTVDTSRDGRNIFAQKYALMSDQETVNWKFPEGWLTLSKAELGAIVAAGAAHIQSAFDWEMEKNSVIDACVTLQELDAVVIAESTEVI